MLMLTLILTQLVRAQDVPAEDIGKWFDLVDLDKSGTIELDEFILLVKKMNSVNDGDPTASSEATK